MTLLNRRIGAVALATVGALSFCLWAAPARAQQAEDEVTSLMAAAQVDYQAGRFADAEAKAERAWEQRKTVDIATTLGQFELKQNKHAEAAEHFHFAVTNVNVSESPEVKARIQELFQTAKNASGALVVKPTTSGATVTIENRVTKQPVTAAPIFVSPGTVTPMVEAAGYEPASRTITVKAGEELEVPVTMTPSSTTAGPAGKPLWPYFVLGGVAALGAGVGIGLTVAGTGKKTEAEDLGCAEESDCIAQGDDILSEGNGLLGGGVAAFGVTGAALIGLVIYAVVPEPSTPEGTAVAPWISPTSAGLFVQGRF